MLAGAEVILASRTTLDMPKRNTGEIHGKKKFVMKSIVKRYPLISYYVFALVLSGLILAVSYATSLAETLFFLGTLGPGLAASLIIGAFWGLWHVPVYFIAGTAQSILRSQVGF
jgi:hypothetical protein